MTPQAQTLSDENNCRNPHLCCMHKCDPDLAKCLDSAVLSQIQCVCFVSTTENMDWRNRHLSPEHITGKQPAAEPKTDIPLELISSLPKIFIKWSQTGRAASTLPLSSYRTICRRGSYEYFQPITPVWLSFVSRRGLLEVTWIIWKQQLSHFTTQALSPQLASSGKYATDQAIFQGCQDITAYMLHHPELPKSLAGYMMTPRWPVDSR